MNKNKQSELYILYMPGTKEYMDLIQIMLYSFYFILDYFCSFTLKIIFQLFIEKVHECTRQTNSENLTKSVNIDLNKTITQEFFEESHNKCLGSESAFGICFL